MGSEMCIRDRNCINLKIIIFLICSDGLPGEWTPADFNTELSIIDEEKYD